MHLPASPEKPRGLRQILSWRRLCFVLLFSSAIGCLLGQFQDAGRWLVLRDSLLLGGAGLLAFGVFEQWPRRLPSWLARWVLQVLAVALAMPLTNALNFTLTEEVHRLYWQSDGLRKGFVILNVLGLLLAPWIALAALVRQKDALARHQALSFDLERSELERQALDARLQLLKAQVAPHFLFNTLANVQALVEAGSPRAAEVLRSLIAYLHAAVPRLNETSTTLGQELQLVRAYLELMHMRMPDRLQFAVDADAEALDLVCPPLTLLTLVENAVRHGIDPGEDGGRIEIEVRLRAGRCHLRVSDTGVGFRQTGSGLGTGLITLRERLRLSFGEDAQLRLSAQAPRGVLADLELPALRGAA